MARKPDADRGRECDKEPPSFVRKREIAVAEAAAVGLGSRLVNRMLLAESESGEEEPPSGVEG